jgi:dolichyl-phosphate beta-glucosyltransferase
LPPFLSIIIPAYNEATRLDSSLTPLFSYLEAQPYTSEILLVENGSTDDTYRLACSYAVEHPQLRVLQSKQRGKGLAVRYGMLEAAGEYRFMCDADFSIPVDQISRFIPPALENCDIAIASREAPGAVRYNEPFHRHFVGRGFNLLIRMLALPGLHDTQCGFKCFSAAAAEILFRKQTLPGWSFDVEVLFIARKMGYSITEIPVPWYFNPDSKVKVLRDASRMGFDLFKIRLNAIQGVYDRPV